MSIKNLSIYASIGDLSLSCLTPYWVDIGFKVDAPSSFFNFTAEFSHRYVDSGQNDVSADQCVSLFLADLSRKFGKNTTDFFIRWVEVVHYPGLSFNNQFFRWRSILDQIHSKKMYRESFLSEIADIWHISQSFEKKLTIDPKDIKLCKLWNSDEILDPSYVLQHSVLSYNFQSIWTHALLSVDSQKVAEQSLLEAQTLDSLIEDPRTYFVLPSEFYSPNPKLG